MCRASEGMQGVRMKICRATDDAQGVRRQDEKMCVECEGVKKQYELLGSFCGALRGAKVCGAKPRKLQRKNAPQTKLVPGAPRIPIYVATKYSVLHLACRFFCLITQSKNQFSGSLLPHSGEKRPMRLRSEIAIERVQTLQRQLAVQLIASGVSTHTLYPDTIIGLFCKRAQ